MNVYFDESGDLGWSFDKPYGAGGSSRYLTIAFLIIPKLSAKYEDSKSSLNLQFIDIIAHIVWANYERNKFEPFNKLEGLLTNNQKFFFHDYERQ